MLEGFCDISSMVRGTVPGTGVGEIGE